MVACWRRGRPSSSGGVNVPPVVIDDASEELRQALIVAEYQAIHEQWHQARSAQQQAIQWTLAAVAVIIAGVLSQDVIAKQPAMFVLAGATVTIGSAAGCLVWLGEVIRMERASIFLRGREVTLGRELGTLGDGVFKEESPLLWASYGVNKPLKRYGGKYWVKRGVANIVGANMLFFAGMGVGQLMLWWVGVDRLSVSWSLFRPYGAAGELALFLGPISGTTAIVGYGYCVLSLVQLMRRSAVTPPLDDIRIPDVRRGSVSHHANARRGEAEQFGN